AFARSLRAAGVSVWIDEGGIEASTLWGQAIVEAIEACKVLVLMLSQASVSSAHVLREVTLASEAGKPILPLYLEPSVIPPPALRYHLAGIQHIEVFRGGAEVVGAPVLQALARHGVSVEAP